MSFRRTLLWLLILLAIAPASTLAEQCRVTIGLVLPLTGNAASYGERARRGATIAQESVRAICKVDLIYGDSRFESAAGVSAYRSLVQSSRVDAVITGSSMVSIPVREMAARDGILHMAIFTSANSFSKANGSSFRNCSSSSDDVAPLVDVVTKTLSAKAGAIFLANDFGEGIASDFKAQLESKGLSLTSSERIMPTSSDFRSEMLRLKRAGTTHLLTIGLPFQYLSIFRAAAEINFNPIFLSPRNIEDATLAKANLSFGSVLYSYPFDENSDNPEVMSFVNLYRSRYQRTPDAYGAEAFESVRLIAQSSAACGRDISCASKFLRSKSFSTVFGEIRFNSSGDTTHSLFLKTIAGASFIRFPGN
jgi:branched-chain amino acid transport system substrate-binding protein